MAVGAGTGPSRGQEPLLGLLQGCRAQDLGRPLLSGTVQELGEGSSRDCSQHRCREQVPAATAFPVTPGGWPDSVSLPSNFIIAVLKNVRKAAVE